MFGAYGFWLPNDPRGSWSKYVWANRLRRFGPPNILRPDDLTPEEEHLRATMKDDLKYPAVRFTGVQARAVAHGFAAIIQKLQLAVYATAIMPDHVHLVVARQEMYAETIAGYLKRAGSRHLRKESLHPFADFGDQDGKLPSPWEERGWKVFLHSVDEVDAAICYVNNNPIEAGLPPQRWSWVQSFVD